MLRHHEAMFRQKPARSLITGKDNTTTVTAVDVTPANQFYVIYSVGPISVAAGDVVSAHFQQQTSYADSGRVMVGSGIVIGTSNQVKNHSSSGFVGYISNLAGSNAIQEEAGTEVVNRTGSYKFSSAVSNIYINAVLYGADLNGNTSNPGFRLPSGYGELVVVLENGVTHTEKYYQNFTQMAVSGNTFVNKTLGPFNIPANTMVDVRYDFEATRSDQTPTGDNQRIGRWVSEATSATDKAGTRLVRGNAE